MAAKKTVKRDNNVKNDPQTWGQLYRSYLWEYPKQTIICTLLGVFLIVSCILGIVYIFQPKGVIDIPGVNLNIDTTKSIKSIQRKK